MNAKRIGTLLIVWAVMVLPLLAEETKPDLAALVAKAPDADKDGKYTGPSLEEAEVVYKAVLGRGAAGVRDLVKLLVEVVDGSDYKARYALHGLCIYVGQADREAERKAVGDGMMASLEGASPNIATFLMGELQFLTERRAVPVLAKYLTDEKLHEPATRALVGIREGAAEPIRKALPKAQGRNKLSLIQALGKLGDVDSAKALLPLLKAGAGDERIAAADALAAIGCEDAVSPLLELRDKAEGHEGIRISEACFRLASNLVAAGKNDEAVRIYTHIWKTLVEKNEPQQRYAVVQGLAESLATEETPALVKRMKDGDPALRAAVLHVFARRKDPASFDAVAAALKDDDVGVRMLAIAALAPAGGEKAVPMLAALLPGEGAEMQKALHVALLTAPGDGANAALAKALAQLPDHPNRTPSRLILLSVLGQRRVREAGPEVLKLASDADAAVRMLALETLAKVAGGELAPAMVALLPTVQDDREGQALVEALVAACGNIGDEKARLQPLSPAIETGEPKHRCALLTAAGRIGTNEAVELLVKTLGDANTDVQDAAMRALEEFPNQRPREKLLEIAKTTENQKHQVMALRGYVRMAEKEGDEGKRVPLLKAAIPAIKRAEERKLVFGSLGNIRRVEALAAAVECLTDEASRNDAARAAVNIARKLGNKEREAVKAAMAKVLELVQDAGLRRQAEDLSK